MKFGAIVRDGAFVDCSKCKYDIIIRNGKVYDYSQGIYGNKDIYIKDGRFVDPLPDERDAPSGVEINAMGCLVLPGLIDLHAHVFAADGESGTDPDLLCIPNGVTTVLDGGSCGSIHFKVFYKTNIVSSVTNIKALLNICANGMISLPYGENLDPSYYDPDEMIRLCCEYPKIIKGIKVRLGSGKGVPNPVSYGIEPVIQAVKIAEQVEKMGHRCAVHVHAVNLPEDVKIADILNVLRKGDNFIHMFQGYAETIIGEDGKVQQCLKDARAKGVFFDCCGGRALFSVDLIKKAFSDGFYPDIIATDIVSTSVYRKPVVSLLNVMSMYYNLGMSLTDILKAVTYTPAQAIDILDEAGTLKSGKIADVAILKIEERKTKFFDTFGNVFYGDKLFVPMMTIKNGRIRYRQIFFQDEL